MISRPRVLEAKGLSFKLEGRQAACSLAVTTFRDLLDVQTIRSAGAFDRSKHRIPVCSGMSGLGKTRILEEAHDLLQRADVTGARCFIVGYGNGHSLRPVENTIPVAASFSWRLLYYFFLDGNHDRGFFEFMSSLPSNADQLTLRLAFETILLAFESWPRASVPSSAASSSSSVNLFVGIDEYQVIDRIAGTPIDPKGHVMGLLTHFMELFRDPIRGLAVFPMLAGTDLEIVSVARSSTFETVRLPMPLLTLSQCVSALQTAQDFILEAPFLRHLFFLGGVPRWIVEYTEAVAAMNTPRDVAMYNKAFEDQIERFVCPLGKRNSGERGWGEPEFVQLAAYAFAGKTVAAGDPGIAGLPWSRIRDSSLCLLQDGRVTVPYAIVRRVAQFSTANVTIATACFIRTIESLLEHVDRLVYDLEPWQLWEKFGAYFHAARINALQILGEEVVPFSRIITGALKNGCDAKVKLRPMEVFVTSTEFDVKISENIPQFQHTSFTVNWVGGDRGVGYVVVNGAGGRGVDIFFALELASGPRSYVVCTDQRKREAKCLGKVRASSLIEKARVTPEIAGVQNVIVGLFSLFPHFDQAAEDLPLDSFVVAYEQSGPYHGSLQFHPASSPCVCLNDDPTSSLCMILQGRDKRDAANAIVRRRQNARFQTVRELQEFLRETGLTVTLKDEERLRL